MNSVILVSVKVMHDCNYYFNILSHFEFDPNYQITVINPRPPFRELGTPQKASWHRGKEAIFIERYSNLDIHFQMTLLLFSLQVRQF